MGEIAWGPIIGWGISILVLVLVLFILFCPSCLFSAGRDALFFFHIGALPEDRPPDFDADKEIKDIERYFDYLVKEIEESKENGDKGCLMRLKKMPDFGSLHIVFNKNEIYMGRSGRGGYSREPQSKGIVDFEPCIVAWEGAQNFYNNYLDGNLENNNNNKGYIDFKETGHLRLLSSTSLLAEEYLGPEKQQYKVSNDAGDRFLYKPDERRFCFISITKGDDCELKDNNKALAKKCLEKIPNFEKNLLYCDDKYGRTSIVRSMTVKYAAEQIKLAYDNALNSDMINCVEKYEFNVNGKYEKLGLEEVENEIKFYPLTMDGKRGREFDFSIDSNLCLISGESGKVLNDNINNPDPTKILELGVDIERFSLRDVGDNIKILTGNDLYDNDGEAYRNKDWEDDGDYRMIYKLDNEHVCFIALRRDGGSGCNTEYDPKGIDDDCFKNWVKDGVLLKCNTCSNFQTCGELDMLHCNKCGTKNRNNCQWMYYEDNHYDECGNENRAQAVVVKVDINEDNDQPTEVWDFRLTSNENINFRDGDDLEFNLNNDLNFNIGGEPSCAIFSIEENSGSNNDNAEVWYVKQGSRITKEAGGNLGKNLLSPQGSCTKYYKYYDSDEMKNFGISRCEQDGDDKFRADMDTLNLDKPHIGIEVYSESSKDVRNHCQDRCPLLEKDSGKNYFKPRYELLCDSEGFWNVCSNSRNSDIITIDSTNYACNGNNEWVEV